MLYVLADRPAAGQTHQAVLPLVGQNKKETWWKRKSRLGNTQQKIYLGVAKGYKDVFFEEK